MPAESYPRYSSRRNPPSSSGFASRPPTYPMIPHISTFLLSVAGHRKPPGKGATNASSPAMRPSRSVAGGSAELLDHERGDPSTEGFRLLLRRSLREHADDGLGARGPHEHAAP